MGGAHRDAPTATRPPRRTAAHRSPPQPTRLTHVPPSLSAQDENDVGEQSSEEDGLPSPMIGSMPGSMAGSMAGSFGGRSMASAMSLDSVHGSLEKSLSLDDKGNMAMGMGVGMNMHGAVGSPDENDGFHHDEYTDHDDGLDDDGLDDEMIPDEGMGGGQEQVMQSRQRKNSIGDTFGDW